MAVTIKINDQSLNKLLKNFDQYSKTVQKETIKRTAQAVVNIEREAKNTLKAKSPRAYNSLVRGFRTWFNKSTPKASVWNDIHIAPYIEFGTVAHVIRAKTKKALYFFSQKLGIAVLVPLNAKRAYMSKNKNDEPMLVSGKGYVDHPGTKAQPFMGPAARKEFKNYVADLKRILKYK